MNRSYKIKPIHATMRLDRWIKNNIAKYPQSLLEKSIRKGEIKLNKKKTNSSYKLKIGDEISFSIPAQICHLFDANTGARLSG